MPTDKIDLLEVVVRIVDAGSLTSAAKDYDVGPSTISRKLTKLEALLQQSLVNRNTHELSLTEAGNRFYHEANDLIAR